MRGFPLDRIARPFARAGEIQPARAACVLTPLLFLLSGCGQVAEREERTFRPPTLYSEVRSPPLRDFRPAAAQRFVLDNGMVVFLIEDHELPLVDIQVEMRVGGVNEPADKTGLAAATGEVIRTGGSARWPGPKLDEVLDDMAARMSVGIDRESGSATLSVLREDLIRSLPIFADVLRNPAFPEDKIELWRKQQHSTIDRRNDASETIADREFDKIVYGPDSPYARHTEHATVNRIRREDLAAFHANWIQPQCMIFGACGDFRTDEMLDLIRAAFGAWPAGPRKAAAPPPVVARAKPGVWYAEKKDVTQATIRMGHVFSVRRDSPDYPAIIVVNQVLSGGYASRLFNEVRSKRGLAYSVFGWAWAPYDRPGVFCAGCDTREDAVVQAAQAVREEIRRLRDGGATADEVRAAREGVLNSFVFNYGARSEILRRRLTYEMYGYPQDFAEKLFDAVKALTPEQVSQAAKNYLRPDDLSILVIGNAEKFDKPLTECGKLTALDVSIRQDK